MSDAIPLHAAVPIGSSKCLPSRQKTGSSRRTGLCRSQGYHNECTTHVMPVFTDLFREELHISVLRGVGFHVRVRGSWIGRFLVCICTGMQQSTKQSIHQA